MPHDDLSEPINDNLQARQYQKKCEEALEQVSNIQQFRDEDTMVDYVFKVGRDLFDKPLDQMDTGAMLRTGGRLAGVYVYLGQKSARARAERDVYAQKLTETEKSMLLDYMRDGYKVTEARSMVSEEVAMLQDFVVQKEIAKNQWENITEAVEKMISFIQSAIKVKEGERFQSNQLRDNGN